MSDPTVTHKYIVYYDEETGYSDVAEVDSYDIDEVIEYKPIENQYMNFKILNNDQDLGTVKLKDKVKLSFPFEGDKNLIEKVKPGCGCTAKVEITNNAITAVFTPESVGPFSKSINVFFKDGIDLTIVNTLGVEVINPKKPSIKLKFHGKIEK